VRCALSCPGYAVYGRSRSAVANVEVVESARSYRRFERSSQPSFTSPVLATMRSRGAANFVTDAQCIDQRRTRLRS